jgi:hypothetical protein
MRTTLRSILLLIAIVTSWTGFGLTVAEATTLDFYQHPDSHDLGTVYFGIPSGDQDRTNYVNYLITLALGTGSPGPNPNPVPGPYGQSYTRSNNDPLGGAYPTAVWALNGQAGNNTVNLGAMGTYTYLFGKYDGPNGGAEVWYVGDLSGIITIPTDGLYQNGYQFGLSGWTLFTGGPVTVPDGGSTLMLLSSALGGIGLVRRYFLR